MQQCSARNEPYRRRQALLYISLAIIGMALLGMSLPGLQFQDGSPIPGADPVSINAPGEESGSAGETFPWLLPYGLAFAIIILFVGLVTALLKKVNIKRVGLLAATLMLLFVFFSLLPDLAAEQIDSVPISPFELQPPSPELMVAPIGEPPAGLLFWVAAGLLLVSVLLTGWFVTHAYRRTQKADSLAMEAEAAVQAIAGGQNLSDVIIHCYLEMERVIAQERGIERGGAVTPREFESYLLDKGIPRVPILQLTCLFEKARYGNKNLNQQDEQEAVYCFFAIQNACRPDQRGIR